MARLRLFFAAPIPDDIRTHMALIQDELRPNAQQVKWVEASNIHLTLKFLGAVDEAAVSALCECAQCAAKGAAAIDVLLKGLGAFPNLRRPRAVWIGVQDGAEALAALARSLEDMLGAHCGIEREQRPFRAHLTIGRIRSPRPSAELAEALQAREGLEVGKFSVGAFGLYRSDLRPTGPVYTCLRSFELRSGSGPGDVPTE